MDEKTEELRNIFLDVSEEETVTEHQEERRGALTGDGEGSERLERVIADMREQYEFSTDLTNEDLRRIVRAVYDDESDAAIATELEVPRSVVFRARMDLHLFREGDTEAPFDLDELRQRLDDEQSVEDCAEAFDVSESTVRRYRDVIEAKAEARNAGERFQDQFDSILDDADLTGRLTDDIKEDGLDDATEGMETNVSF